MDEVHRGWLMESDRIFAGQSIHCCQWIQACWYLSGSWYTDDEDLSIYSDDSNEYSDESS